MCGKWGVGEGQRQHEVRCQNNSKRLACAPTSRELLTLHQLSAVHLSGFKLDGDDVSERLVKELDGDAEVGHVV